MRVLIPSLRRKVWCTGICIGIIQVTEELSEPFILVCNYKLLILVDFVLELDLGSQGFGDLLAAIRNKNIPLQNMHFVVRLCKISGFHAFKKFKKMVMANIFLFFVFFILQTYRNNLNKVIAGSSVACLVVWCCVLSVCIYCRLKFQNSVSGVIGKINYLFPPSKGRKKWWNTTCHFCLVGQKPLSHKLKKDNLFAWVY